MQTKDFSITLDMMRTLPFRPFEVVEGDTGNILHVTLLNNGDAMDLTGCTIHIAFASSIGFTMQSETSGITKSAQTGAFDIALLPTAYGAGNVSADVQADWNETDTTLDAFIRNKPAIPSTPASVGAAPASHAAQHQQGGSDPVTPIPHAARHASGGADAISPGAIGAASLSNGIVAQSQARSPLIEKNASFTLAAGDVEAILLANSSSEVIVTMPSDATYNFPIGTTFNFIRWGSGALSFSKESGTNWLAYNNVTSVSVTGGAATVIKVASNTWWLVCG